MDYSGLQKLLCIAPAYDQHFSQVYMDLTFRLIDISLDILTLVGEQKEAHLRHPDVPSWATDWRHGSTGGPLGAGHHRNCFYQYRSFCASKTTTALPQLLENSLLKLRGRKIDTINIILFNYDDFRPWSNFYPGVQQLSVSHKVAFPPTDVYVLGGTNEEAFWRTIINDRAESFNPTRERVRPANSDDEAHVHTLLSVPQPRGIERRNHAYHAVTRSCEPSLYMSCFFLYTQGTYQDRTKDGRGWG